MLTVPLLLLDVAISYPLAFLTFSLVLRPHSRRPPLRGFVRFHTPNSSSVFSNIFPPFFFFVFSFLFFYTSSFLLFPSPLSFFSFFFSSFSLCSSSFPFVPSPNGLGSGFSSLLPAVHCRENEPKGHPF
ncbi:hypothetical protein P168DRAFT_572 [Aspergillus campestris IBT 28561]|uniref:Transmembrane protein n=1 Tax=Aspergillus campestris (strain IBT 28561) TaxID=1392248 RepID=A0A2I1DCT5_ASPC2|nr:uncharacterized protein P168DRAFT_572 [Aspergillus campestris IBT 28561]PKY07687.1 hypothetical protein P168DRAFT_572 [Aspergillus campestris IBT 28561]